VDFLHFDDKRRVRFCAAKCRRGKTVSHSRLSGHADYFILVGIWLLINTLQTSLLEAGMVCCSSVWAFRFIFIFAEKGGLKFMKPRDFIGGTNFRYAKFAPSFCSKDKWTNPIYKLVGSRRTRHGARENRRQSSRNGSFQSPKRFTEIRSKEISAFK
jgi:hypothetical protein